MSEDLKLALFDYDGTIVDSAIMIVKGAIEAFRMCGLPDPDPKRLEKILASHWLLPWMIICHQVLM